MPAHQRPWNDVVPNKQHGYARHANNSKLNTALSVIQKEQELPFHEEWQ